jgi:hypothetical protein
VSSNDTAWAALLIRRSSVRARRGPLVFVQVRSLQTASDDPEPSLITSKWHIYGTSHGTSCGICGRLPRIGVLKRMFSQGSDGDSSSPPSDPGRSGGSLPRLAAGA